MMTGTRNVSSSNRAESLRNVKDELKKYKIGIAALQDIRFQGAGIMDTGRRGQDAFYEQMEKIYEARKYDVKITLGHGNARVGKDEAFRPNTVPNSIHEESDDNENLIANFTCSKNIIKTQQIWRSPDGMTFNQTDHVPTEDMVLTCKTSGV
jgi:hypothetical protein